MARIVVPRMLAAELFGGQELLEVPAKTLFAAVHALEALGPGFAERAGTTLAMAVDGVLAEDWSTPLRPDSEVLIVSRVAGGETRP